MRNAVGVVFLLACAGTLSVRLPAGNDGQVQSPPGLFPVLTIAVETGYRASSFEKSSSGSLVLQPQRWNSVAIAASQDLCLSTAVSAAPGARPGFPPDDVERAAAHWAVSARLVSIEQDTITFDLRWTRVVNDPTLDPNTAMEESTRVSMRDGASGILDLVRAPTPSDDRCASFALSLGTSFGSQIHDAAIAYDLWLVHTDRDGQRTTERFQGQTRQGEDLAYQFRPMSYTGVGTRAADGKGPLRLSMTGTIRGRVRTDGLIDLAIDGWRVVSYEHGSGGTGGRKLLTVSDGETVEVEMPSPMLITLDRMGEMSKVFAGHRTAIRVTARRIW
jgi:hypothetical protein